VAYRIAAIQMTLGDLQGHSPTANFFTRNFSYSYEAVDKISTDSASRGPSAVAELLAEICEWTDRQTYRQADRHS